MNLICKTKKTFDLKAVETQISSDLMICGNEQGNQLPSVLFVIVLQSDHLTQVKTTETARWDLVKGDRDRLLEVTPINRSPFLMNIQMSPMRKVAFEVISLKSFVILHVGLSYDWIDIFKECFQPWPQVLAVKTVL